MQLESEPTLVPADLAITGIHEDAPHPGVEAIRVTERGQITPCNDEGFLRRILGAIRVPGDESGDAVELVDPEACQL
jgi:hypothetical protein